jgi:hypothetical protein
LRKKEKAAAVRLDHWKVSQTYLRYYQKYITIEAINTDFKVTLQDGDKVYRQYLIQNFQDARLMKLLKTLKDTLVD